MFDNLRESADSSFYEEESSDLHQGPAPEKKPVFTPQPRPGSNTRFLGLTPRAGACTDCGLYQPCLSEGLAPKDLGQLDRIIKRRRPLRRGEHLFQVNTPFRSIYAVHSGSIRTYVPTEDGNEQITGFHLHGELLGLDAISTRSHPCAAKALETTSLCEIPYEKLTELANVIPSLQHQLLRIMSQEILHDHSLLTLLGKRSAEERLAALLISLSDRYRQRGFSHSELILSMSRNDIANYHASLAHRSAGRHCHALGKRIEFRRRHLPTLRKRGEVVRLSSKQRCVARI